MGERLLRELQLEAARRATERRNLLHDERGQDRHRELAPPLQYCQAPLIVELQTAGPGGPTMAGCATRTSDAGHPSIEAKAGDALTSKLDHLMGAGHMTGLLGGL